MANIGFVGLGNMGLPMALRLLQQGHKVCAFDVRVAPLETFLQAGGKAALHLQETVLHQDIVITMLQTSEQVVQICLGEGGLYEVAKNILHIDCSTIGVAASRKLHERAKAISILSIDAPVSGGITGAEAGTLTFLVGGREYDMEKAKPILACMGKEILYIGPAGSGQAAKICNNMILGVSMIAVSEAFLLARKLGLSDEKLQKAINHASGQCWVMDHYVPVPHLLPHVPANHDYQPGFSTEMMLKDLLLSQTCADQVQVQTPLTAHASLMYQQFFDAGGGDLDFSAIVFGKQEKI